MTACGGGSGAEAESPGLPAAGSPDLIEFVLDVQPSGDKAIVEVRAAAGGCLARVGVQCGIPIQVTLDVNGGYAAEARAPVNNDPSAPFFSFVYDVPTAIGYGQMKAGEPALLQARVCFYNATMTFCRSGALFTDFRSHAQAGFFGAQPYTVDARLNFFPQTGPLSQPIARTGALVIVEPRVSVAGPGGPVQPTPESFTSQMRIALRPTGSQAVIRIDPASQTGNFVPDVAGTYVVEFTPVYQSGLHGWPVYGTVYVQQSGTDVRVTVDPTPPGPLTPTVQETPVAAAGVTRLYVQAQSNGLETEIKSVEAVLDGASLGTLSAPNVMRSFSPYGNARLFAFDVPTSRLENAVHTLVARVVTQRGEAYAVQLAFTGATDAQVAEFFPR